MLFCGPLGLSLPIGTSCQNLLLWSIGASVWEQANTCLHEGCRRRRTASDQNLSERERAITGGDRNAQSITDFKTMAGGMEVHSNKFVEQWAANRENLELAFRFNRRTIPICLTFGVFVPLLTYYGIVAEFKKQDKLEGRSRRFLGD